jgi:heterodisulfide reductase subunit C
MAVDIPYYPLIVVPVAVAIALFWRRAGRHLAVLRAGRPLDRFDRVPARIWSVIVYVIGQKRLLNDLGPGVMHAAIFWGFLVLLVTTGNYFTNGLVETILRWPLGGIAWLLAVAVANLFIGLILAALAYAAWRRIVARPARLALSRDAFVILGMILGVVSTELIGDALRFVVLPDDPARGWALLAGPLSLVVGPMGTDAAAAGFGAFAWAHIGFVLAFGAYLPYSKHLHIITSEPNVYFRNLEPRGALRKMDLEGEAADGQEPVFGARGLKDLTWRHLLDGLSCTECGRCMEFCPASMTGKTLSPKHFMEGLRDQIVMAETALAAAASAQRAAKGGANGGLEASDASLGLARERVAEALALPLVDNAIPEEAVWQCTTCGWCVEGCPVLIEHVDSIVEIRRNLVLEESRFPKELSAAFRNMETAGNPWGQPKSARLDWAKDLEVPVLGRHRPSNGDAAASRQRGPRTIWWDGAPPDGPILYWVGCAGAFARRGSTSRCLVRGRPARATLRDGPATSTSTRCWQRRTWPPCRPPTSATGCGRSSPAARTASTRSATSTRSSGWPGSR